MKILLLGEYSGVHNSLSTELKRQGYNVLLISDGDGYKSFDSDVFIKYRHMDSNAKLLKKILDLYYLILSYSGFKGTFQILKYNKVIKDMKNYDVVQLINPTFLADFGSIVNLIVFLYLKKNNKKIFLCALGDDFYWIKFCLDKGFNYSMFDKLSFKTVKYYLSSLVYVYGFLNPFLNKYIVKNSNAVIPGLYDYYAAYNKFLNCTEIVPIIVEKNNDSQMNYNLSDPVKIFHGWQTGKDLRKGNNIFDKAIRKLIEKYPDKVEYNIVGGVPYDEYIKKFGSSHIFIDQCISQDCGVNALLGMREGKVVFSGFEPCVKKYYGIDYAPLINALPDEDQIFSNLEKLILDKQLILQYSSHAKRFIEDFHSPSYVVSKFIKIWKKY